MSLVMAEARSDLIKSYFHLRLKYNEIVNILNERHGVPLSERQLIRVLRKENLYRYRNSADIMTVVDFIMSEQRASGVLHGYRWMYEKMKCRGINAKKEEVRLLMGQLDPEGRENRQKHKLHRRLYLSKGPNYIWHMDSYDKLRPFGICINGCIDGFSRKIIWLNAYYTSSNPRVIGGYYAEALEKYGGCPAIIRADRGTENTVVCHFQRFLRRNGNDAFYGERSFLYGRSTSNQRIESWWNFLRRECIEFWLDHFDKIKANGYFDGDYLDKNILQFCFLPLIQNELDSTTEVLDAHVIRPSSNPNVPTGRPNVMFQVPELYAVDDYICNVNDDDLNLCKETATFRSGIPCDEDIYNLCLIFMAENNFSMAEDPYQAMDVYIALRQCFETLL